MTATWRALGTTVSVVVARPEGRDAARTAVERELAAVDRACSRFRPDSDLARVNAAGGRWTPVGPLLVEAVRAALRAARLTAGAVDPTVGAALVAAGYDRDFAAVRAAAGADHRATAAGPDHCCAAAGADPRGATAVPDHAGAAAGGRGGAGLRVPGWRVVEVRDGAVRVPAGVALDLGATAKALAADRAARAAAAATGGGVLVNLGGDLATAGPAPDRGWIVRVADDHAAVEGECVRIAGGALATSSTAVRRWRRGAATLHHILDPATGTPAAGPWRTVSVAAATCVDANTASTAAIVRGAGAEAWLAGLGLPARLCRHDGSVVRVADWP